MMRNKKTPRDIFRQAFIFVVTMSYLTGCSVIDQVTSDGHSTEYGLSPGSISGQGLAFITPSAATGQETNRHALASSFAEVMQRRYPDAHVVAMPQFLSAVNRSGLTTDYTRMIDDYETTGILEREALRKMAAACQVRYIGHLDLAKFEQSSSKRLGVLGLRLIETKLAAIRVFLQIWDAQNGNIVWEGSEELTFAYETTRERPVTFSAVAEKAADRMLDRFPQGNRSDETQHLDLSASVYAPQPGN